MEPRARDLVIVEALLAGDDRVFARVVAEHQASFLRIARVWVPNVESAKEAVQKTWLIALESLERFEGRSSLRTWLLRHSRQCGSGTGA